jgi:hypothetical protein
MHMLSQLLAVSHLAWHLTQYVLSVLCRDDMHWATGMGDCASYSPGGRNDGKLLLDLFSLPTTRLCDFHSISQTTAITMKRGNIAL